MADVSASVVPPSVATVGKARVKVLATVMSDGEIRIVLIGDAAMKLQETVALSPLPSISTNKVSSRVPEPSKQLKDTLPVSILVILIDTVYESPLCNG